MTILVTGSEGLIGRFLSSELVGAGHDVRGFDIARNSDEDVRSEDAVRQALDGVEGVILLAAVSRVIWAEQDPQKCISTNVLALEMMLRLCLEQASRPWVLFASSREVYGTADSFPVHEDAPQKPMNLYARSKAHGERVVRAAAASGLNANICRLSSVYGCPRDHKDRVAMAFARAASKGGRIRMEGRDNVLDFTAVHEVAAGLTTLVEATAAGEEMPPIHFVSGKGTSLIDLAKIACQHSTHSLEIEEVPARNFDVAHFVGDPSRAEVLLGWKSQTEITEGLPALIYALSEQREHRAAKRTQEPATASWTA
jgi:UDP-glucose 4-epimerase